MVSPACLMMVWSVPGSMVCILTSMVLRQSMPDASGVETRAGWRAPLSAAILPSSAHPDALEDSAVPEPARIIPIACPFGPSGTVYVYYIDAPEPALIDVG